MLPGILKTARMGYDGKGQVRVRNAARSARGARVASAACRACWRSCLPLEFEVSVVDGARSRRGTSVLSRSRSNAHRDGVLSHTIGADSAGRRARHCVEQAQQAALQHRATSSAMLGVLCVEFFVLEDGSLRGQRNGAASAQLAGTTASTPARPASSSSRCAQ